jgi:subtilisin family serine protease
LQSNKNIQKRVRIFHINWLWLLLLLIPLLFWLFSNCTSYSTENPSNYSSDDSDISRPINSDENYSEYLPSKPGVVIPIDKEDIISDKDDLTKIVSNRLNIVLKNKNIDLNQFAIDFKNRYPSNRFEIIYFDTLINRLQIEVPPTLLYSTKAELPQKLETYDMLIWPEHIFTNTRMPNDTKIKDKNANWYLQDIQAFRAWDITQGTSDIKIAIVDDGFDINHKDLKSPHKKWNTIKHSSSITSSPQNFHGTHVAGTALATGDNAFGISGIAPNCSFMPIQIADEQGTISMTAVIDAILYAAFQGADVVNLSLGMYLNSAEIKKLPYNIQMQLAKNSFKEQEEVWNGIFEITERENCTVVMAAGNQDILVGIDPMQRSSYTIKVAASDRNNRKALFSNYGSFTTVSAPGVDIYSCLPNNKFDYMTGTSMACPMVSGAVALIKSINPEYSSKQIACILKQSARPINQKKHQVGDVMQLYKALILASDTLAVRQLGGNCVNNLANDHGKENGTPSGTNDTLKIPENVSSLDFLEGKWRSTTPLYNDDEEEVVINFDFNSSADKIELVELNGQVCDGWLDVNKSKQGFSMSQSSPATCGQQSAYSPYTFTCYASAGDIAQCEATNIEYPMNKFNFNLIKVK